MATPTNAPSALGALVAALQAIEIEKILRGDAESSLGGREVYCNLRSHNYSLTTLGRNRACRFDHQTWEIRPARVSTLKEALALASPFWDGAARQFRLYDDVFATMLDCPGCGRPAPTFRASRRLTSADRLCTQCGETRVVRGFTGLETLSAASLPADVSDRPLTALGLLANDVFSLSGPSGQVMHFRILDEHNPPAKEAGSVAVVGCGNIGSHLIGHLARMALVNRVILVDPDAYEAKNLSGQDIDRDAIGSSKVERQAARLRAIRPGLAISAFRDRFEQLPLAIFQDSLIVSCVDSRGGRRDINRAAARLGATWIDGAVGGVDLLARVAVYLPGETRPCIECEWDDADYEAMARTEMACRVTADAADQPAAAMNSVSGSPLPDSSSTQPVSARGY